MHESEGPPVSQPDRGPQIPDSTPADFWGNKGRINELVLLVISIFRQISTKVLLPVWSGDLLVLFCCELVVVYFSFRSKNLCIFIFFHLLNASLTRWRLSLNYLVFNQCRSELITFTSKVSLRLNFNIEQTNLYIPLCSPDKRSGWTEASCC